MSANILAFISLAAGLFQKFSRRISGNMQSSAREGYEVHGKCQFLIPPSPNNPCQIINASYTLVYLYMVGDTRYIHAIQLIDYDLSMQNYPYSPSSNMMVYITHTIFGRSGISDWLMVLTTSP